MRSNGGSQAATLATHRVAQVDGFKLPVGPQVVVIAASDQDGIVVKPTAICCNAPSATLPTTHVAA